ncbi:MAG: ABC transporter permease [Prevotella sp.]|nr:ABC transporter permease [Prevotella sp.]
MLKSYFTFLSRNKLYTAVNVVGLSISLAFVIIIALYAQMEFGRDKWHAKADRIYSICTESEGEVVENSHWCMQGLLRSNFPEIENSCAVLNNDAELTLNNQEKKMVQMMAADSTFFQLFDFPLTLGNRQHVLKQSNAIVLSEETARLLFGSSDPIGKTVTLNDSLQFVVTGVMPKLNHTYMRTFDVMVSTDMADVLIHDGGRFKDETMNSYGQCRVYLLAREGCDLRQKEDAMNDMLCERIWLFKKDSTFPSRLQMHPLKEMYFLKRGGDGTSKGDHQLSWLLILSGLVILLFAVTNYVNLTMAQSTFRMREMAMRRLLGSQRSGVIARLIGESVMLCLISLMIAVVIVYVSEPYVNWLVNNHSSMLGFGNIARGDIDIIQTADLLRPQALSAIVGFSLLLGIAAGLAPAIVISSAHPIEVVRGTFRRHSKMFFSRLFIIVQHVCTIAVIGVTLVMWLQVRHLINAPLGWDTERLLLVRAPEWSMMKKLGLLFNEVNKMPCVETATLGLGSPFTGGGNTTNHIGEKVISFQTFWNSPGWMKMLGIPILADYGTTGKDGERNFVTRSCLAAEDLPADARSMMFDGEQLQIDGIIGDFCLGNILSGSGENIVVTEKPQEYGFEMLVKYRGSKQQAMAQIRESFERIFKMPMEGDCCLGCKDMLQQMFVSQIRIMRLLTVFAVVALIVSMLGLLAMSTYYIQQRRKEVAVRKVFGSTNGEVLRRLLCQFVVYVVVAFVVAIPIIYKIGGDWLSQYSYRISLSLWIPIAAGTFCLVVSLLAVFAQSWFAANENPINNIKTE